MERTRDEGEWTTSVGGGETHRGSPRTATAVAGPSVLPAPPGHAGPRPEPLTNRPGRLTGAEGNRPGVGASPGGGVQAAEAEAGGVALGVGVGVGHDVSDDLEVPGAAPAPQGGRGAGAAAHHREAGDGVGLDGDDLVGVVAHGAVGDVAEPLDLGLGVAGHVGQDAVVGEQGVDRLGVSGDHGVAQERVEVSGRARRDLGGVGVRVDLSAGTGQGSGFVGTATHRPRVRPDVEYMRDQQRSVRLTEIRPRNEAAQRVRTTSQVDTECLSMSYT